MTENPINLRYCDRCKQPMPVWLELSSGECVCPAEIQDGWSHETR